MVNSDSACVAESYGILVVLYFRDQSLGEDSLLTFERACPKQ